MSEYLFYSWLKTGISSLIDTADDLSPGLPERAILTAGISINDQIRAEIPARNLRIYGPGEVTGFDPRQVIRTEPMHLSSDFEPNYFPAI